MNIAFVIPSYNCAVFLPHSLESCINQNFSGEISIYIVNDGSTDSTRSYLDWLEKEHKSINRRIYIINTENNGRSKARNIGIKKALEDDIEYFFMLDADDYNAPNRVKACMPRMQSGSDYLYGSAEAMDFSGTKIGILQADKFNLDESIKRKQNEIVHSSVVFNRKIAENFPYCEDKDISDNGLDDWEHQLRIATSGAKMDFLPVPIVAYRILQSSISQHRDQSVVEKVKDKYLSHLSVSA